MGSSMLQAAALELNSVTVEASATTQICAQPRPIEIQLGRKIWDWESGTGRLRVDCIQVGDREGRLCDLLRCSKYDGHFNFEPDERKAALDSNEVCQRALDRFMDSGHVS